MNREYMSKSTGIKDVLKWVGVAVVAAIPVFLLVRKIADRQESPANDAGDIFSEELRG